jgi:glycosyltransferase involved in cell wall biosynthesis
MARPVITTDTVGCRETVEPGRNGWLVPVGDATALADAIADSATDRARLERMGRSSRELAERCFDVRAINDQMLLTIGLLAGPRLDEQSTPGLVAAD